MRRREFLKATAMLAACPQLRGASQTEPIRASQGRERHGGTVSVGTAKQLFIDDKFIASSEGIRLTANPPLRTDAINFPPLKDMALSGYLSVLEVDGSYRMYYHAAPISNPARYTTCLSTSDDGVNWVHPNFGLYDVNGSNNVVLPHVDEGSVFIDPKETDGCRFWWVGTASEGGPPPSWNESQGTFNGSDRNGNLEGGLYLFKSKDGIRWERKKEGVALPFLCDTQNQVFFDPRINEYVAYVRGWDLDSKSVNPAKLFDYPVLPARRFVARATTPSLDQLPFSFKQTPDYPRGSHGFYGLVLPENSTPVIEADSQDPPRTDVYTPCVNLYPWAADSYVAFPSFFRHYDGQNSYGRDHRGKYRNDGPLDSQLAVSRDGILFHRYREPYISLGLMEEHDVGGTLFTGVGLIKRGNFIYQYYTETPFTHNVPGENGSAEGVGGAWRSFHIRMASQRLDGFVSVDAGPDCGTLTTPSLIFEGNKLQLNIDCGAMGEAWVEIQDEYSNPIEGYQLEQSVSLDRNGLAQDVWWRKGPDISQLAGRPIRLFIKLRSAKLYAFQFIRS